METFIEFFTFKYPNIKYVVLGSVLLSMSASIVGCFTFVRKKALMGDVISHAVLPGICLSFMISGTKDPFLLILGAFATGWISILAMDYITAYSKLKEDTATGISLSVFFGIGILMMTYIQQSGNAAQSGLDTFLFGKAAALVGTDLYVFSSVAVLVLLVVVALYKEFKFISFDPEMAQIQGIPVKTLQFILTSLTVLAVVTGVQAVGVVLMAAMLITPAAAAKYWTSRFSALIGLAALFAALSGISGAYISYAVPSMPTGPWIVLILSLIALISIFFSPRKGVVLKFIKRAKIKKELLEENLLKTLYKLENENNGRTLSINAIKKAFGYEQSKLNAGIQRLKYHNYLKPENGSWKLTPEGRQKGKRIVRLHRLWELYLTEYLRIAPDHVHEDAETVEHIITPELEAELQKLLDYPERDPHDEVIPR